MDYNELQEYVKNRIRTYTWHKLNLKDVTDEDRFEQCRNELMTDIMDDTEYVRSILASGVPKPIADMLEILNRNEVETMKFYVQYKSLFNL